MRLFGYTAARQPLGAGVHTVTLTKKGSAAENIDMMTFMTTFVKTAEGIENHAAEARYMLFPKGVAVGFNFSCFNATRRGRELFTRIKTAAKDAVVPIAFRFSAACIAAALFVSCATLPVEKRAASRSLTGAGVFSDHELASFLRSHNPALRKADALYIARCYISEAHDEGINADVAFAQMCLETGFLRFGGLVGEDMHNYCGLGATGDGSVPDRFPTVLLGVRAHIQHLNAYGDTDELVNPVVDKRAEFVSPRGKAPTVFELAGTWASDKKYGEKLDALLSRMERK